MMEISVLEALLNNLSSFFHLSSHKSLNYEPAQKYYQKIEKMLKLLQAALNDISDTDILPEEAVHWVVSEVGYAIDELRELFENWHPLKSKIFFVSQCESLISKVQASGLKFIEVLKSSSQSILKKSSIQIYLHKTKRMGAEQASGIIGEAIRELQGGSGLSKESLASFRDYIGLQSNQDLLIEIVALEILKENTKKGSRTEYFDKIIAVVTHLHEGLVMSKQTQSSTPILIPADFCCPLSLELMKDPVIIASGQTYEREFIQEWIDLGLNVCPKTRQTLSNTHLIPNYSVKALISNWCKLNNVNLPMSKCYQPLSLVSAQPMGSLIKNTVPNEKRLESGSQASTAASEKHSSGDVAYDQLSQAYNRTNSDSSIMLSPDVSRGISTDGLSSPLTTYSSDGSGELASPNASCTPPREPEFSPRVGERHRNVSMWRRPSDSLLPKTVSSSKLEERGDLPELETQVKKLAEDLKSTSLYAQRNAMAEIRLLSKHNENSRIVIPNCGTISLLVDLLRSADVKIQENAVTTLLNLSLNDNNKIVLANSEVIEGLIYVLGTGTTEGRENAVATFFSLSAIDSNRVKIGRFGGIKPLVDFLENGTLGGKKDAVTALYYLSICNENKAPIVQAGAMKYLVDLMDPTFGMVDKAVAVLANLASIREGRDKISEAGGIKGLVSVVELGSARGKENAAAALLQLCTNSNRFCSMVIKEGAVPPLVALSTSGTPRAQEKAEELLRFFRNQRHNYGGRR